MDQLVNQTPERTKYLNTTYVQVVVHSQKCHTLINGLMREVCVLVVLRRLMQKLLIWSIYSLLASYIASWLRVKRATNAVYLNGVFPQILTTVLHSIFS